MILVFIEHDLFLKGICFPVTSVLARTHPGGIFSVKQDKITLIAKHFHQKKTMETHH